MDHRRSQRKKQLKSIVYSIKILKNQLSKLLENVERCIEQLLSVLSVRTMNLQMLNRKQQHESY
jgi:hypothetical protein